jgi:hypothetical protein
MMRPGSGFRRAGWAALVIALAASLPGSPTVADTPVNGPFSNVPQQHWCYDAVQQMAQDGIFTGYPDGAFTGKRPLTRYEFAVAIQRMVQEIRRDSRDGLVLSKHLRIAFQKLAQEFTPELEMLGTDVAILRRNVLTLTSPWLGDAPDLATCTPGVYPGVGVPQDTEYVRGCQLAVQEWQRGEVVFYVAPGSHSPRISASTGVLYRTLDTRVDEPGKLALISGHNAEVKRRLERYGAPASAHPAWVEAVQHPEQPWRAGAPQARLDPLQREAASADGQVLLRLEEQRAGRAPLLRVTTPQVTREVSLPGFDLARDALEVCWSPTLELLHLALRRPGQETVRVRVTELKRGETLHQVDLPAVALRPAAPTRALRIYPRLSDSQ